MIPQGLPTFKQLRVHQHPRVVLGLGWLQLQAFFHSKDLCRLVLRPPQMVQWRGYQYRMILLVISKIYRQLILTRFTGIPLFIRHWEKELDHKPTEEYWKNVFGVIYRTSCLNMILKKVIKQLRDGTDVLWPSMSLLRRPHKSAGGVRETGGIFNMFGGIATQ